MVWSMQMVHVGEYPGQSSVTFLPMIDMNPSDMSCIFSTLSFISDHAIKYNQTPIVTFDQPLYWKALMIIHHGNADRCLHNIVLRLGGFHAEMSFLGCIGHLMQGSGLAELLETVYASNAVGHMLQGKAVARALRGHFLVDNALHALLVANIFGVQLPVGTSSQELSRETKQHTDVASYGQTSGASVNESTIATDLPYDTDKSSSSERHSLHEECIKELKDVFESLLAGTVTTSTVYADEQLNTVCQQIKQKKDDLKQYPTAALWIQYMEMIEILRTFITAERTGNWELSLYSLQQMLPYFAAAGHNLYLKSVYVYLQMMFRLQDTNPTVYEAFRSGLHIIRRSDRFWGGLPPDLVIEQVLMRSVKTTGGMTRGKGMTECQRVQWLLSMPSCAAMNVAMQTFCGTDFHTSSQHKEMGKSRMERDYKDSQTFLSFLTERNPFCEDSLLRNIETGVTADASVNAYKAKEIGNNVIQAMPGNNVFDYSFKKSSQVVTQTTIPSVTLDGETVQVDPQLLFQRLTAAAQRSVENIPQVFTYELCSVPSSLFDTSGFIRQPQKPALADAVWSLGDCSISETLSESVQYVLDGGSLLQRIPWTKGATFSTICNAYVNHVTGKYPNAVVVFDGYRSGPTTKDTTHLRRTRGVTGTRVYFTESTPFKSKKEQFLSNSENKQEFILMLSRFLEDKRYTTMHAESDADLLIVMTAVEYSEHKDVVVIGEDTDLLVLLCYHANLEYHKICFKSELKQRTSKGLRVRDILKTKVLLGPDICRLLPFIHALTGCDTTSRIYGISKGSAIKKAKTDPQFGAQADVFLKESSKDDIVAAGECVLVGLYGGVPLEGLDLLRFRRFANKVMSSSSYVQVCTLPPTSAAAKYHSMRVYYQVQEWMNTDKKLVPKDWGWSIVQNKLLPIKTDLPAAPDSLLKMIKCTCKQNCDTKRCTCRKHGLDCSIGCSECRGMSCTNVSQLTESDLTDAV